MTVNPIAATLASQTARLIEMYRPANIAANVDGMFARYVSSLVRQQPFAWAVDCGPLEWAQRLEEARSSFALIAALGYQIYYSDDDGLKAIFSQHLSILRERESYPDDRFALAFFPVAILGVALGIVRSEASAENMRWLVDLQNGRPTVDRPKFSDTLDEWARAVMLRVPQPPPRIAGQSPAVDLASVIIGQHLGLFERATESANAECERQFLEHLCQSEPDADEREAAVLWVAATLLISSSISRLLLSRNKVVDILKAFPAAMRRWRWDGVGVKNPIQWPITQEREVQDILYLMLRPVIDDLIDEEPLGKLGHQSTRVDFGIPSLRLLIEAKYIRKASDFRLVENAILEDLGRYFVECGNVYERLIVFIYDASSSVQEHDLTRRAIMTDQRIVDVVIVSRPSQIPAS